MTIPSKFQVPSSHADTNLLNDTGDTCSSSATWSYRQFHKGSVSQLIHELQRCLWNSPGSVKKRLGYELGLCLLLLKFYNFCLSSGCNLNMKSVLLCCLLLLLLAPAPLSGRCPDYYKRSAGPQAPCRPLGPPDRPTLRPKPGQTTTRPHIAAWPGRTWGRK